MEKYTCHVCGYPDLEEPPWDGNIPSHNICDCCGIEFGYEDCKEGNIEQYRSKWITSGCKWFDESIRPVNWDCKKQLQKIGVKI